MVLEMPGVEPATPDLHGITLIVFSTGSTPEDMKAFRHD